MTLIKLRGSNIEMVIGSIVACLLMVSRVQANEHRETKEEKQTRKRIEWENRQEPKAGFPPKVGEAGNEEDDPRWRYYGSVSLIKVIARPEKYHKKFVATEGFLRWSRNPFLFINEVEGKQFVFHNALFVNFKENVRIQGAEKLEQLDNRYVYLEGVFDQWYKDPHTCPNGSITVSRVIAH